MLFKTIQSSLAFRSLLRKNGFLTRDSRKVERKKYGQPGARKRFQSLNVNQVREWRLSEGRGWDIHRYCPRPRSFCILICD